MTSGIKDDVLGVTFPEQIGKLVFFPDPHEYATPGLGYSMRYQDDRLFKVDVYVYDNNLPDIGEGTNSKRVMDEFISVIQFFSTMIKMGLYHDFKNLDRGTTTYPPGSLQFVWHRCQYRQSEGYLGLRVSETHLSAKSGKFIKVRLTLPEEEFTERQAEVSNFLKHLAEILGTQPSATTGD